MQVIIINRDRKKSFSWTYGLKSHDLFVEALELSDFNIKGAKKQLLF